jgi:hypothetical protein
MHHLKRPDAEKKPQSVKKMRKLGDKKHLLIMPTKKKGIPSSLEGRPRHHPTLLKSLVNN